MLLLLLLSLLFYSLACLFWLKVGSLAFLRKWCAYFSAGGGSKLWTLDPGFELFDVWPGLMWKL